MSAVGTVAVTHTSAGRVSRIAVVWTADASGAVTGHSIVIPRGRLVQVRFIPSGTQVPTDQYDATLLDAAGVDLLSAGGANLSATTAKLIVLTAPPELFGIGPLSLDVKNAGSGKSGTVELWVTR